MQCYFPTDTAIKSHLLYLYFYYVLVTHIFLSFRAGPYLLGVIDSFRLSHLFMLSRLVQIRLQSLFFMLTVAAMMSFTEPRICPHFVALIELEQIRLIHTEKIVDLILNKLPLNLGPNGLLIDFKWTEADEAQNSK